MTTNSAFKNAITLLFLSIPFIILSGTPPSFNLRHFNTTNGLKSDRTVRVLQDHRSYYWFGTIKGIQRFDGYQFKEFPVKSASGTISGDFEVHKLYLTKDSVLLIGTSIGLLEFNELHNEFTHIPFPAENNDYRVTDICPIDDSTFFLNSHTNKGVFIYNRSGKQIEHAHSVQDSLMKSPKVRQVLKGPGSTFFFHIDYDLYQYDRDTDGFQKCEQGEVPPKSYFHYGLTDPSDTFWLLSATGLYYMPPQGELTRVTDIDQYCPLNKQVGSSICLASDSTLYVAFDWWGVAEISMKTKKVVSEIRKSENRLNGLTSNQIYSLYLSPSGELWWCSDGAYLLLQNLSGEQFLQSGKLPETQNYAVLDILESSDGTIWVGTDGGGLHSYSITENKTSPSSAIKGKNLPDANVIMCLHDDSKNNKLWAGTYGDGLYSYGYKNNRLQQFIHTKENTDGIQSNRIWDIEQDTQGNLLISSLCRSVSIFNSANGKWKQMSSENGVLRGNCVTTIEKESNGTIWFGYTEEGLDAYDDNSQTMKNTVPATKDRIFSICHSNDTLWLGSMNGICAYSKKSNAFIAAPICNAFKNIRIHDIYKDSFKRIWVASEDGLYYFRSKDTLPTVSILSKYFSNKVAKCIYETRNGHLLIGGINGLLSVPVATAGNASGDKFEIHITDFSLFNETYTLHDSEGATIISDSIRTIKLPYNKNYIGFSFSSLNIDNNEKISYEVRVSNYYPEWRKIENGKNTLELPNLQAGKYTAEIKAVQVGNEQIYASRSILIEITPPFWHSWWFRILVIFGVSMLVIIRIWRIKNKNRQLSAIVDKRTKELKSANKELEDQYESVKESKIVIEMKNEELTEALSTKDKLLGVIGHDFRNPLGALSGYASILKKNLNSFGPQKIDELVSQILSISESLTDQMVTVLDWAKGQMDTLEYKPVEIDLEPLLTDALQLLQQNANQKNITITIQSDYRHNAHIDARMISTVFRNLLSNAIKFTPAGGSVLVLIQESDEIIEVSFADSGIGIEKEKIALLFDSFNPNFIRYGTAHEPGTGLGLQICKTFVEKNKGKISAQSEPDAGSLFTVALPKADSMTQRKKTLTINYRIKADDSEIASPSGETLLIIEDNIDILELLEEIFRTRYNILKAMNGNTGVQIAKNMLPDLIISDINMPQVNGLDLCKIIRNDKLTCHIPVILITAETIKDIEAQSYQFGATDFISKPFDPATLLKKVEAFLQNRIDFKNKISGELNHSFHNLPDSNEDEIISKILALIEENYRDSSFEINSIAEKVGVSRTQLWRKIKSTMGKTPSELIKDMRLNKSTEMLKSGKYRISEIAYYVGFSDQRYFSRVFQKEYGISPSDFMKTNK